MFLAYYRLLLIFIISSIFFKFVSSHMQGIMGIECNLKVIFQLNTHK